MNSDGTSADLPSVQNEIEMLSLDPQGITVEVIDVIVVRRGERVMLRNEFVVVSRKQWEVGDPGESEI